MSDVTQILGQIESGDGQAAEKLLPLVYDELRKLAAQRMAQENPGQTLQATALVHEAYIRLVDTEKAQHWDSRGHFFRLPPKPCGGFSSSRHGGKPARKPVAGICGWSCPTWIRRSRNVNWICSS